MPLQSKATKKDVKVGEQLSELQKKTCTKLLISSLECSLSYPEFASCASTVVFVRKNEGSNRICVEYRRLYRVCIIDPEPMTPLVGMLQDIGSDRYFITKIDPSKDYWQIPVAKGFVYNTTFVNLNGRILRLFATFATFCE